MQPHRKLVLRSKRSIKPVKIRSLKALLCGRFRPLMIPNCTNRCQTRTRADHQELRDSLKDQNNKIDNLTKDVGAIQTELKMRP